MAKALSQKNRAPAKAVGWNEMLFGRNTRVVPSNIGTRSPMAEGRFGVQNHQYAATAPSNKLLWPLVFITHVI